MHVRWHQYISVDGEAVLSAGALEAIEEEQVIGLGTEHRNTIITALDNVKWYALGKEAWQTSHDVMKVP